MNIIAFFSKLFCNTQEINKFLIKESYSDYISEVNSFNNKYPELKGLITVNDHEKLSSDTKLILNNHRNKIRKLKQLVINNIIIYSKNYPDEKISKNRFIVEYREYPHRLEQNIDEIILIL